MTELEYLRRWIDSILLGIRGGKLERVSGSRVAFSDKQMIKEYYDGLHTQTP